jgi:hypothetical protein
VPPGGTPKFVVSKQLLGAGVYAIDGTHLHRVADIEAGLVTGASWSPDGTRIALVSYTGIFLYDAADFPRGPAERLALPPLRQAESIAWNGNDDVLVGSEGVHSQIFRVAAPPSPAPSSPATSSPAPSTPAPSATLPVSSPAPSGGRSGSGLGSSTPVAALILVLTLVAVAVARVRRRGRGGLG